MTTRKNTTTIRIRRTTKEELEKLSRWGMTHDDIICTILAYYLVSTSKEYSPDINPLELTLQQRKVIISE